jgi:hypothetical protein
MMQLRIQYFRSDTQADGSDEELDDLIAFPEMRSPACNSVCRPLQVTLRRVTNGWHVN